MPSILWLRPASQFDEALSLCQSCHAIKAAVMTIAVPKAANNATMIAIIETKVRIPRHRERRFQTIVSAQSTRS
jgi:hypothetical protein